MRSEAAPLVAFFLLLGLPAAAQERFVLENETWRASIDPASLAIEVAPAGEVAVSVSSGVGGRAISGFTSDARRAGWDWPAEGYHLDVSLSGPDLLFTIAAAHPGELAFLSQPPAAIGRGLILPLAEGHYVEPENPVWRTFLAERLGEQNTTQDLSLPLWGLDHGGFTLHWILTNPFNNRITLTAADGGLAMEASHAFTALDPASPLTFLLHLGGPDLLAGAKRYRAFLIETGQFETLEEKIATTPEAAKLVGAAHVYLWGNGLLAPEDIRDWPAFMSRLKDGDGLAADLRAHFEPESLDMLATAGDRPFRYQQQAIVNAVNEALNAVARASWQPDATDSEALTAVYARLRAEAEALFGEALAGDRAAWGGGLSLRMVEALVAAGLERLWIGLGEGWEGGLWHPEAVAAAVEAGYLIAPYDSYETALPLGVRTDWATAHLGEGVYKDCAIIRADGTPRAGFQQSGHYTDPGCVRPLLQDRVAALQEATGFNSWFVDSYAAGMVFDSYRPSAPMSEAENARGNSESLRWINEALRLPAGSEDGNAVTSRGILFAHGMETPFIGWGDAAMHDDRSSPNYLGGWYPPEEPAIFFKPTPISDFYRTIHFDPAFRLPLYQAVFHDAVITTHHWAFDSLKLDNVMAERELAQILYAVPPLYHLGATRLQERLPLMARQDPFFRPLHELLAHEALVGFRWLGEDRLVQETEFSDGTRLIANFAGEGREADGLRLPARSLTAVTAAGGTIYSVD